MLVFPAFEEHCQIMDPSAHEDFVDVIDFSEKW
jgi:hypothetical protein